MKLQLYQVDAFTDHLFGGNPAAVCPLEEWIPDELMQQIAMENNLSETAFFVKEGHAYHIRWFTPALEVALCGHATLASSHVIFSELKIEEETIHFHSKSGHLEVFRKGNLYILDFPSDIYAAATLPPLIEEALGMSPAECYMGKTDYLLIYESETAIMSMQPDHRRLRRADVRGIIVTAPGTGSDFVSRFYAPGAGIDEDPVTGSAHTTLIPYWSKRLKKNILKAVQVSRRIGHLDCEYLGDRVYIGGECRTFLKGDIYI